MVCIRNTVDPAQLSVLFLGRAKRFVCDIFRRTTGISFLYSSKTVGWCMDRRRFLQGLGCAGASIPGLWPTLVSGAANVASAGFAAAESFAAPSENTLAGIDCWIPFTYPDGWMLLGQQAKLLETGLHEVDLVRVTFADAREVFCKHWQGEQHAARHFRPDLLLLNFNPARVSQHPALLDQAIHHKRAGNAVLAIVRGPGLMGRDALRSNLTCQRLLQSGVPVLASLSQHDLAGVLLDLVGATHDQSFDWGDFQRMLRDGPITAFARGCASNLSEVVDAVEFCVAQLRVAGLERHQVQRAQVTVYGAMDYDTYFSVARVCRQLSGREGDVDLIFKWNQWVIPRATIGLHVLAAGSAADLVAGKADV